MSVESSPELGPVGGAPPPEALPQPDGSFLLQNPDGSSVRWTKRLDGSWRKPQRQRAGWVGDLEREKYSPPPARGTGGATTASPGVAAEAPGLPEPALAMEAETSTHEEEGEKIAVEPSESVADDKAKPDSSAVVNVKKHDLQHRWALWVHQRPGQNYNDAAYAEGQQCVHEFGTAEDYWCMIHHSFTPSRLGSSDYSLFRAQMTPAWEDPSFKRGGRWVAKLEKLKSETLDELWVLLTMALVGEAFADYGGDAVGGAIISVRNRTSKASLWLSECTRIERVLAIGHRYRKILTEAPGLEGLDVRNFTFEYFGRGQAVDLPELYIGKSTIGVFQ